jgi:hypothetical protein
MRDDLLDAHSCIDWALSQIQTLQNRLKAWHSQRPYHVAQEIDAQTGDHLIVAHLMRPLDPIVPVEVGLIINAIRTALDLLTAALARRNGQNPSADTHFPVFASDQCMIDPLTGIEGKKWLSTRERAVIKALKPYPGGDDTIWPLHQLDVRRKHYRLVEARPGVHGLFWNGPRGRMLVIGSRGIEPLEDKTILYRSAEPFDMTEGENYIASFVVFNEPEIGLVDEEVTETLRRFAARVNAIIKLFDSR